MAVKIKRGDPVIVLTGRSKGQTGKVLSVDTDTNRVLVSGVNMVIRHVKPSQKDPEGGRISKESSIHRSNLAFWDEASNRGSRVGFKIEATGKKVRYLKRTGQEIRD
jgi:large subunit ribosomal protein L24